MIAISNNQRDTILRLLDYMASKVDGIDTRAANARRMAGNIARQLRAKKPEKPPVKTCGIMYLIGGLDA